MLNTVYARQIATAKRIIAAKGELVTWQSNPDGVAADLTKPWIVGNKPSIPHPVKIVFFPLNRVNTEYIRLLSGTEIQIGDFYGLMAAVDFQPSITDTVIKADKTFCNIVSIDVLAPDGVPILYTINFKIGGKLA